MSSATSSAINVAVVVPLIAPGGRDGYIDADALRAYTRPGGRLTLDLQAVIGTSAVIGIDPMIITSIRLLGSQAPDSAIAWLDTLRQAENETFALAYADSDITVGLQAGSRVPLAPTSIAYAIDPELFTSDAQATPDPAATGSPESPPALPTPESVMAWAYTLPGIAWPQPSTTTSADIESLTEAGYSATLLNSANVKRPPSGQPHVTVATSSAVVTDDALSTQFATTIAAQTPAEWAAALAQLEAQLARTRSSSAGASAVIAVDRSGVRLAPRLRETLTALDTVAAITPASLRSILANNPTGATLVESPHDEARVDRVTAMLRAEQADAAFSTVAENPALITGERRMRLLATLAPQWNRTPVGWASEVEGFIDDSRKLRASVRIADSSDLIFGDRGSLPIYVTNDLPQPVTVFIVIEPRTPLLTVENSHFELTIEPSSQRRAAVPAVARSNGLVTLDISLLTRTGTRLGDIKRVVTTVQAGWETPLTVAIGVLVLAVFGFGIFRTINRRRRVTVVHE